MVLPVAETIEKQLMVLLRDRQADLTDFLGPAARSMRFLIWSFLYLKIVPQLSCATNHLSHDH